MLRTLFVLAIIAFGAVQSFRGPFYALLFYLWIAYFRPESWLWFDFVSALNLSLIVGVVVLGSTLLSSQRLRLGFGSLLMGLFLGQSLLSTLLSPALSYSWPYWQDFAKSTVISLLIVTLVNDERRLRLTFVVIALSLGGEAAKQGWAQLLVNPGGQNTNELPMLGDNNCVAVGMFMLVPIMIALARTARSKKERLLYRFLGIGTLYRGIITYSRGGFLACGALVVHYVVRSQQKLASCLAIILVGALILPVLPDSFWDRMQTIDAAREDIESADTSIQGRLYFWQVALVMASDNFLTGIGHNAYNAVYNRYDFSRGEFGSSRSVHSSWFGVLSELGYPGLLMFLVIIARALYGLWLVRRITARRPDLDHLRTYAGAIESALVTFVVGGTFVTLQYLEMLWHFLALSIVVERLARERAASPALPAEAASQAPAGISARRRPSHGSERPDVPGAASTVRS